MRVSMMDFTKHQFIMVSSIQLSRSGRVRQVTANLAKLIVFLSLIAVSGPKARATTYSLIGSHTLTWTSSGGRSVCVSRTGGYDSLTVYATLTGSSNFGLSWAPIHWNDTAHDSAWRWDTAHCLYVTFRSYHNDTSNAVLILHDSHHSDTISLTGYGKDTSTPPPPNPDSLDFSVQWTKNFLYDTSGLAISNQIGNRQHVPISIHIWVADSTYWSAYQMGDSIHHGSFTLWIDSIGGSQSVYKWAVFGYTPHGLTRDSVIAYLECNYPHHQLSQVTIYYQKLGLMAPIVTAPDLGVINIGDSVCGDVWIYNPHSIPDTIGAINLMSYGPAWRFHNLPHLPYIIDANDSVSFQLCFHPDSSYTGGDYTYPINVVYHDAPSGWYLSINTSARAHVPECIEPKSDTVTLDDVILGGYEDASQTFVVRRNGTLRADSSYSWNSTVTILSPSLPKSVHAGDSVTITFRTTPTLDSSGWFSSAIPLRLGTCSAQIVFVGYAIDTSSTVKIDNGKLPLLAMKGNTNSTTKIFSIQNSLGKDIIINSVALAEGSHFSVKGITPHSSTGYDTLRTNGSLTVIVEFDAASNGFYHDSLIFKGKDGAPTAVFNLEGIRAQSAGVNNPTHTPVTLLLTPNPAEGPVRIDVANAQRSTLEIFDMLGTRLLQIPNTSLYNWNSEGLPNGSYIVRADGMDINGTPFVISKRLVLER